MKCHTNTVFDRLNLSSAIISLDATVRFSKKLWIHMKISCSFDYPTVPPGSLNLIIS